MESHRQATERRAGAMPMLRVAGKAKIEIGRADVPDTGQARCECSQSASYRVRSRPYHVASLLRTCHRKLHGAGASVHQQTVRCPETHMAQGTLGLRGIGMGVGELIPAAEEKAVPYVMRTSRQTSQGLGHSLDKLCNDTGHRYPTP